MAKKEFGQPVGQLDEIPPHLRGGRTVPRALRNGSPSDYSWLGDDGNWDPQAVVAELAAPAALLRLTVQAIVDGNPSSDKSSEDRVEQAMRALLGLKGREGRRKLSSDAPILRRMAGEYFQGFYGFKEPRKSLNALADWALGTERDFASRGEEWKENRRRTIARKFKKHKDQLLAEFSSAHNMEIQAALSKVRLVLKALADMGIGTMAPTNGGTKSPDLNP